MNSKISQTTYNKYKNILLEKGIIKRREITDSNKKIPPTFYSLTQKGKMDYNLRISETGYTINKKRVLYQLLLFFDCYKRSNIITERQLKYFLKKVEIKFENMENMDFEILKQIQNIFPDVTNIYKINNNISIGEHRNSSNSSKYYYVILPGFTIDEFLDYLKLIKKCNEPHPFTELSKCLEIPYIHYHDFSKDEISEAVLLLKEHGILKPIVCIYKGEMRYDICNDSVKEILKDYWFLHIFDFHISFQRLVYNTKLSDADKSYMKLYFGEQRLNHKLALIYDIGKKNRNELENEFQENYDNLERLKELRTKIIKNIDENSRLLTENDTYILSLVKEICLPQTE